MISEKIVALILTGAAALMVFGIGESIRRRLGYGNEVSRKLVHTIHGLSVAVLPFLVGYWVVYIIEILFLLTVLEAYKMHIFSWLWRVGRKSWGEYMYPLGVIAAAFCAHSKWIFLAGVLELALADAAAALIGKGYGAGLSYQVFRQNKSIPGSAAFFVVSVCILSFVMLHSPAHFALASWSMVFSVSFLLMLVENAGVYGVDNLLLPVATVLLLNAL